MTASELNRKLLFCGYSDLTDYLRNSPLNRYLYKMLLVIMKGRRIEVPITTMLSEIYYQCIRVRFDSKPGVDVSKRYLDEEAEWLGSKEAAVLVFEIVWMLFQQRRKLSFHEECFVEQLKPVINEFDYQNHQNGMLADMREKDIRVPDEFVPMPCPVKEIPMVFARSYDGKSFLSSLYERLFFTYGPNSIKRENMWRVVTDNFSHSLIEKYVNVYSKLEDQQALLDLIRYACPRWELSKHEDFFYMLSVSMSNELNGGGKTLCLQITHEDENGKTEGEFGFVGKAAQEYLENFSRELRDVANQYKQERDDLQQRNEDQKKAYDLQVARLEAKLAELKDERNQLAHQPQSLEESNKKKELVLTLSEVATHVKERFSKSGADEVSTMLYHMAMQHGFLEEETFKLIDSIVPAILKRDIPQTNVDVKTAGQVNINPQRVINRATEKDEKETGK